MNLPEPVLVTQPNQLDAMLARLMAEPAVGVDTESDSLYVYHEKVCLLQFSIPDADYLVDPLALGPSLAPLGQLFAAGRIAKIFHAAEYDVLCLKRDAGFEFRNLFDTMWAARILGWKQIGLGAILEERFAVQLDKRWQRHNWGARPLEKAALSYARLDSHYLLVLREMQSQDLQARGLDEQARETFDQLTLAEPVVRETHPDDFWHVKGVWDLPARGQAILRELYLARDHEARRRDWPPFKLMGDKLLVTLAQSQPRFERDLAQSGMTPLQIKRYGAQTLEAVKRGLTAPIPRAPRAAPPDYGVLARYEKLRAWRKQTAAERGVDPDVIVSNAVLMAVAQARPAGPRELAGIVGLGPWRIKTFGVQLAEAWR